MQASMLVAALLVTGAVSVAADTYNSTANAGMEAGLNLALTQGFLDYARDIALPVGLAFLRRYPLPDPLITGDDASISWKIYEAKIGQVDANAGFSLVSPSSIKISLSNLTLGVSAKLYGKEDVWPHPYVTAGASADISGGSAAIQFSISTNSQGKPSFALTSCNVNVDPVISISGLGILDSIANLLASSFKSEIDSTIKSEICDTALRDNLIKFLNKFFQNFNYHYTLPLPAPFNVDVLDYHILSTQVVASDKTYLEVGLTGEVQRKDGGRDPATPDTLPVLTKAQLGAHMASAQLGEYPLNSFAWSLFSQDTLHYKANKADLPSSLQGLLSTSSYCLFIPSLCKAFPSTDMAVTIKATTQPKIAFTNAATKVSAMLDVSLSIPKSSTHPETLAFSLTCPFSASGHLEITGLSITGGINNVNLTFTADQSPYGGIGPTMINFVSPFINSILNNVVLVYVNSLFKHGYPLPSIGTDIPGLGSIEAKFVNPILTLQDKYALIGSDVKVTYTPYTGE